MSTDTMKVHAGSRAFELRIGKQVIARISTILTNQQKAGMDLAERYNSQPALMAAAQLALDDCGPLDASDEHSDVIISRKAYLALRAAVGGVQ